MMRKLSSALTATFLCAIAQAVEPSVVAPASDASASRAIFDRDPQHLWNRLYRAVAVRTEGGIEYGLDNAEPYRERFDDSRKLVAVLDEFLRDRGERRIQDDLKRAVLLNDLWAAFDLTSEPQTGPDGAAVRRRLARVIKRLTLSTSAISRLPDNYAEAVRSAQFAEAFDPVHPEKPFLPPDLFDPQGPWVQIWNPYGAVAPFHLQMLAGRSAFMVFIRCPGGRQETLSYLETLNLYPTPFSLQPADIGTSYPSHEKVRMNLLRMNPDTPQFPAGTIVALVRRMLVIDEKLEPVQTRITQKVQFRVYRRIGTLSDARPAQEFRETQSAYEFVLRRRDLRGAKPVGLDAVAADEAEYQLTSIPMGGPRDSLLKGPLVFDTCGRCHSTEGIFSVNTYSDFADPGTSPEPQLLPTPTPEREVLMTTEWKKRQFEWGLLRGLLESDKSPVGYQAQGQH